MSVEQPKKNEKNEMNENIVLTQPTHSAALHVKGINSFLSFRSFLQGQNPNKRNETYVCKDSNEFNEINECDEKNEMNEKNVLT